MKRLFQTITTGGGIVPDNGIPTGNISYKPVNQVTLLPFSAAVLFYQQPSYIY